MIATIIILNAISPFRENLCLLTGRAPERQLVEQMRAAVSGVAGVHDLRAECIAPGEVHLGMHIEVARGTPIEQADEIASAADAAVHRFVTGAYCVIHVDPSAGARLRRTG